jgi:hypothetical protein
MDATDAGRYLRKQVLTPGHVCTLPEDSEDGDVYECGGCRRVYIWHDLNGYGFNWGRVYLRAWWFRLDARGGRTRVRAVPRGAHGKEL